jgi:hypothetical protein
VVPVHPDKRSKSERLGRHIPMIRRGHIFLPEWAVWAEDFIDEFVKFPGQFDDQVDTSTQFFDWIVENPRVPILPKRTLGTVALASGEPFGNADVLTTAAGGVVLVRRRLF